MTEGAEAGLDGEADRRPVPAHGETGHGPADRVGRAASCRRAAGWVLAARSTVGVEADADEALEDDCLARGGVPDRGLRAGRRGMDARRHRESCEREEEAPVALGRE